MVINDPNHADQSSLTIQAPDEYQPYTHDNNEEAVAATSYLNADLGYAKSSRQQIRHKPITSLSRVGSARKKLTSALNETNRLMRVSTSQSNLHHHGVPPRTATSGVTGNQS